MAGVDYEHGVVPQDQRRGWMSIAAVWIAIGIDLSGAFLGAALGAGLSFSSALAATMLGSLLLGVLAMFCARVGAATGLSTAMISRAVFGRAGGIVLTLMMTLSLTGWFAVQAGFFGTNLQIATRELVGVDLPTAVFVAGGGILMMLTAIWGYRSISSLSNVAVPLLLILLAVGVVRSLGDGRSANLSDPVDATFTFGGAVSLVMGIFVLGAVSSPDMARWARTPRAAMTAAFVGFFFGNSIIIVVALVMTRALKQEEIMQMFFTVGMGLSAVVVLVLAQWTTNSTNVYSAALSFSSISNRIDRRITTVVLGVTGIVIAALGTDWFVSFISAMGTMIAPFGGVYLATYLVERGSTRFAVEAEHPTLHVLPLLAWAVGILVSLATTKPSDGLGLGLFTLTTIPALDGLLVAFAVQTLLTMAVRRGTEVAA